MKNCKICGSINQDYAERCAFCNCEFDPASVSLKETQNSDPNKTNKRQTKWSAIILLLLAASYLAILPIAFTVGGWLLDALPVLLIGWIFLFIVLIPVLFIPKKNSTNNPHPPLYTEQAHEYTTEDQPSASMHTPYAQTENNTFFDGLFEVYRRSEYATPPTYDTEMSCEVAALQLAGTANSLDAKTARTLLAALAARRMIVLYGNDTDELNRALANVAKLTGEALQPINLDRTCATPNDLCVAKGTEQAPKPSAFLSCVYAAHAHQRSVWPVLLEAQAPDKLSDAMNDMMPYLKSSTIGGKIKVKDANRDYANITSDVVVALPANARLFLAYCPARPNLPSGNLLGTCAFVNLKTAVSSASIANQTVGALPFERLLRLCDDAEEIHYLSEDNWKKIDELTEQHASNFAFTLDNKLVSAMERFVGVYMAAGGTQQEALDAVLASILLPAALTAPRLAKSEEAPAFSQLLDTCFGLENLPACAETLKKLKAD